MARDTGQNTYRSIHQHAQSDPNGFWLEQARAVDWTRTPSVGVDQSRSPFNRWFADGELNACHNALDRHVAAGRGDQAAILYDSPVTGSKRSISYRELTDQVATFAGVLKAQGVDRGDRVVIYMPMVPEALVAMLACARLGAVHSVVFGGFAARELAVRVDDCQPKVVVSASCGIEPSRVVAYKPLLDEALALASHRVPHCIVLQRDALKAELVDGRDHDWDSVMQTAEPAPCVSVNSNDPLYILYTSGTTGKPKGVVRDVGGSVVSLLWTMPALYDVKPGDVYWAASDIGWVVGHAYIVYGPLFHGCTTVLYEGKPVGTPDAGAFWRVIEEYKVNVLFTAPTAIRAIKKEDPQGKLVADYDIGSLRSLFVAGERCDPDTLAWSGTTLGVPVIDHWWQTETGWAIAANPLGIEQLRIKSGSPSVPMPGYDVRVLDNDGAPVAAGDIGAIVVKLPLPPGTFTTLWNADDRYVSAYFDRYDGFYETGDAGYMDDENYVYVMARTDDVINVAGHRLSTGAMEEVLAGHPDVAECAVMGASDTLKGQLPVGLVILNAGVERDHDEICAELLARVRTDIGPVAAFKSVAVVERLPKTRSGKILRGTLRAIADQKEWTMPATIEDPTVLDEVTDRLKTLGYAGGS